MEDKRAILAILVPRAVLKALTPEAERAVPDGMIESGYVSIRRFPFRIGRESRGTLVDGRFHRIERPRDGRQEPNNDLYLVDEGPRLHISREHLRIERTDAGYLLVDRGSSCGASAGGVRLGAGTDRTCVPLRDGDTIAIGTDATPFLYRFIADLVPGQP